MNQQCFAFDTPAKLSRRSDPITSQKSAAETEPKLGPLHRSFMACLKLRGRASTANEVAGLCVKLDGGMAESYRKRAGELASKKYGFKIEQAGERPCEVTGKSAMTFRVKEQQLCRES